MNRLWSHTLKGLSPYTPGEQAQSSHIVKLNTNEHALQPSSLAIAAAQQIAPEQLRRYPDPTSAHLTRAIAAANTVSEDQVLVANGSDEVLAFAWAAFLSDGGTIPAIPSLTYTFYPVWAQLFGHGIHFVPMRSGFKIDIEAMTAWDGPLVFPNPNAPSGIGISLESIESMLSAKPDRLVVVDEAYYGFGAASASELISRYDNLLITRSFSKSHALAGLRVGYALGHVDLIEGLRRVKDSFNSYPLDAIAQVTATAAILDTEWFKQASDTVQKNREDLTQNLTELGFSVLPSLANFVLASHPHHSGLAITEYLRTQDILVRSWPNEMLLPWVRITVGTIEQQSKLFSALANYLSS